nr:MAG TPA: hypothetical protein [Caudoviricetes sp.]
MTNLSIYSILYIVHIYRFSFLLVLFFSYRTGGDDEAV